MMGDVYSLLKQTKCHELECKHYGKCDECEFGTIREQAAKDHDRMIRMKNHLERIAWNIDGMSKAEIHDVAIQGIQACGCEDV